MTYETIMAGFGGQGLLFSGKVLAHAALIENKELSWLPSYGPEMRGGTCNCSVIVSDEPVGSPIIAHPNVLMVMNEPSLDKFEDTVAPGGTIFVDSSLIGRKVRRTDVEVVYIPATQMAKDMEALSLANMIILGAIVEKLRCVDPDKIEEAKSKVDIYNGSNPEEPGFMIEIGWDYSQPYVRDRDYFDTDVIIRLFVKEPDIPAANSPEILYIKDYIRKTEQAILAGEGYEEYLDVDSMVDWFIIAELTNNTEMGFYRSCYMYKPEGGKLIMGPVWDFDMAFGNHSGDIPGYDGWATAEATYWLVNDTWATYLIKDAKFMEKVKARWLEMRQTLLDTAFATIDRQYAIVKASADVNFEVWDILHEQIGEGTVDYTVYDTYEKQVQYVREFITKRAAWIDRRLGTVS